MTNTAEGDHSETTRPKQLRLRRIIYLAVFGIIGVASAWLVTAAEVHYPGQRWLFLVFVFSFACLGILALPKPRLYGYSFLAMFLLLGFVAKSVAYLGLGIALIEPTGNFNGSGRAWDAALLLAIVGCLAVVAPRLVHLATARRQLRPTPLWSSAPSWYERRRLLLLGASIAGIVGLNIVNLIGGFYEVGVTTRLVLPAHLNVLMAWLIVSGLAIWAATLVGWEVQLSSRRLGPALLLPFAEAVASVSTLSRAAYLFRALSYLVVATQFPAFLKDGLSWQWKALLLILLPAGFVVSIAAVSLLRVAIYPGTSETPVAGGVPAVTPTSATGSPSASPTSAPTLPTTIPSVSVGPLGNLSDTRLKFVGREIGTLVIGRWIGIEGTMAVSSYPGLSLDLLGRGLRESPTAGESALYQRISGSYYQTSKKYTFLTVPGPIAVLYFSGSIPVLFGGMALLTALLISFEMLAARLLANGFVISFIAITLANAVAQMDFPYLLVVFFFEQAVAVVALSLIGRSVGWTAKPTRVPSAKLSD